MQNPPFELHTAVLIGSSISCLWIGGLLGWIACAVFKQGVWLDPDDSEVQKFLQSPEDN